MQFPMALLRATECIKLGKLVQHETLRDNKLLTMLDTPGAAAKFCRKGCIIFFPHQWLSSESPDPSRQHFEDMTKAIQELVHSRRLKTDNMYVWVDYYSIHLRSADQRSWQSIPYQPM